MNIFQKIVRVVWGIPVFILLITTWLMYALSYTIAKFIPFGQQDRDFEWLSSSLEYLGDMDSLTGLIEKLEKRLGE